MELTSGQIRQTVDTEQVFGEWLRISSEIDHRYRGAMAWKVVAGRKYLYRKTGSAWRSLGPHSAETEQIHQQFHDGRETARARIGVISARLDEMAAINRAMRIGRVPLITARLIRKLDQAILIGTAFDIVGTTALYLYERLAGVRIESGLLATGDIDLLFDARTKLKLIGGMSNPTSLLSIIRSVDRSFHLTQKSSFLAANDDGFLVDLIMPTGKNRLNGAARTGIGIADDDLVAVEIEGLQWLVNSPKVEAILIDERGYPFRCSCPDPRSFVLHKFWLATREDRDPLKKIRDIRQAEMVAKLIARHLPHLKFEDTALGAMPRWLRDQAAHLPRAPAAGEVRNEPNW